jgi:hypothetical protein
VNVADRVASTSIVAALLGATIGFGGAAWWSGLLIVGSAFSLVIATLVRLVFDGNLKILKSPLTFLGLLVIVIGMVQLIPLPGRLASRLSPHAREIYGHGFLPRLALMDDPNVSIPEPASMRSPASLDRASTLHWIVGATACLALFWGVSHYADRMQRLYLVWGCVIAAFLFNGTIAVIQISTRGDGLFGYMIPGEAAWWAPSSDDLLNAPGSAVLRDLKRPAVPNHVRTEGGSEVWAMEIPYRPQLLGTMMGGPGAILALGSMALPLAFSILLHVLAPKGSRERISDRLRQSGHGGLAVLLCLLLSAVSVVLGLAAGPWYSLIFVVSLAAVGLPSVLIPGVRWPAAALSVLLIALLLLGVGLGEAWTRLFESPRPISYPNYELTKGLWREGLSIFHDFPVVGVGMGSFQAIHPYYKTQDASPNTAMSSLIQWGAESGIAGLSILAMGAFWCVWRVLPCLKKVGSADSCLAYGLIGSALGLTLLSAIHWTFELSAVAVSASALGGTWNRWLAGGTDLFVERG